MKTFLQLKGLSLAAEARIQKRFEKSKHRHPKLREKIHLHRTIEIRSEARSTHLALGFLRGRDYSLIERPLRPLDQGHIATKNMTRTAPNWKRVEQLVTKYGQQYFDNSQDLAQTFSEWKDTGTVGLKD